MNLKELSQKCSDFNYVGGNFSRLVKNGLLLIPGLPSDLAKEFDVNEATLERWSKGGSNPLPKFQRLVIKSIQEKAQELLN